MLVLARTPTGATSERHGAGRAKPATIPGLQKLNLWHPPARLEQPPPLASPSPCSSFQLLFPCSCEVNSVQKSHSTTPPDPDKVPKNCTLPHLILLKKVILFQKVYPSTT